MITKILCWSIFTVLLCSACSSESGDSGANSDSGSSGKGDGVGWGIGGGGIPAGDAADGETGDMPTIPDDTGMAEDGDAESKAKHEGFPSQELGVTIIGPTGLPALAVANPNLALSGILFGSAEKIVVECSCGSPVVSGSTFWNTEPVVLSPGDNTIVVRAIGTDGQQAVDTLTVTYNPLFAFDGPPVARPNALIVNTPSTLFITIPISTYPNFDPNTVVLQQVSPTGTVLGEWPMVDNGDFDGKGDEVPADGVFSTRLAVTHPMAETMQFRVRTTVFPGAGQEAYIALSARVWIDAVDGITEAQCKTTFDTITEAQVLFQQTLDSLGITSAHEAVVADLKTHPDVAAVGMAPNGTGVWVVFQSGLLGFVRGNALGTRGAPSPSNGTTLGTQTGALEVGNGVQSRTALLLSPFADEFAGQDETVPTHTLLETTGCPPFSTTAKNGEEADLAAFAQTTEMGLVQLVGHGAVGYGGIDPELVSHFRWEDERSQAVVWSGQVVNCAQFAAPQATCSNSDPQACGPTGECVYTSASGKVATGLCLDHLPVDLRMGRLAFGGDGRYVVLPSYFQHRAQTNPFPGSLIYLGTCHGAWNGSLLAPLYASGAKAIAAFTGTVSSAFAFEQGQGFFQRLFAEGLPAGSAILTQPDPDNKSTWFRLFGASNLDLTLSEILNPDFETATTAGWTVQGDGRVIAQLAGTLPVTGKFMSIVSTGLGYTVQTGELSQAFCIPGDRTKVTFWWKFYSEEFLEWCGSKYQDTFETSIESAQGQLKVVTTNIDALCHPDECLGCGTQFDSLIPSDVSFDKGEVYHTQWRKAEADIIPFAGTGPVTMRFFVTDLGDSIFDTAVLVDSVKFE
ncbi:MAG: hypothetical protein HUU55_02985 [Myxococcales bacterium]|nr:hypothetical protein [Myxococcales bacterium]